MDAIVGKRVIVWSVAIFFVLVTAGGIYMWRVWSSLGVAATNNNQTQDTGPVTPATTSPDIQATYKAVYDTLQNDSKNQVTTSEALTATQKAVQQSVQQQSGSSAEQQTQLDATQKAVEAALKQQQ